MKKQTLLLNKSAFPFKRSCHLISTRQAMPLWYLFLLVWLMVGLSSNVVFGQSCSGEVLNLLKPTHSQSGMTGTWTAPANGPYKVKITSKGARGGIDGNSFSPRGDGGKGAIIIGEFIIKSTQTLEVSVGAPGGDASSIGGGGGGGGSGARISGFNEPLILSGGGAGGGGSSIDGRIEAGNGQGGAGNDGAGGGGLLSGGGTGFTNGNGLAPTGGGAGFNAMGGNRRSSVSAGDGGGGYGGGGGGNAIQGGGGGGYSGGNGSNFINGVGGGSINYGANQTNTPGGNYAGGQVIIECLGTATFTANFSATQPVCVNPTQGSLGIDLTGDNNGNTAGLEYAIVAGSSFSGSPTFSSIASDPFNITSGFGTQGSPGGSTYTVRIRLKYNPSLFLDYTYTLIALSNGVIYVKHNAAGVNNGTSWTNAFTDLQSALAAACSSAEIWVAAGTYKPTTCTTCTVAERNISFSMKNNLAIYGGFNGTENSLSQRNWVTNVTTLSGDIGTVGNIADNSAHVVVGTGTNATAVLDGFTITKGNAADAGADVQGGGMWNGNNSSPTVVNCIFSENNATHGGAVYVRNNCFPSFTNCVFQSNTAADRGGAILTESSSTTNLTNCTFSGNTAFSATISNQNSGFATIKNCIIWGNPGGTIQGNSNTTYCIVQGGYPGMGNLSLDPLFVSATNLHLQACSPAVNAGTATGAPATDYDGDARPQGAGYDIGFDEYTGAPCCPAGNILYVKANASGANNGTSWANAFTDLQAALAKANQCTNITQIWVAAGTYKPTTGADRTISFVMKNNLAIYGGFIGTETMLSQRNWVTNVTTLSGDIGTAGDNSDNSYRVVYNSGLNNTAVLDGFTISGANANGSYPYIFGGMNNDNSSPVVTNCTFSNNTAVLGGGMVNRNSSSPIVTNCTFFNNVATSGGAAGGAIIFLTSSGTFTNCKFTGNSASNGYGGAIEISGGSPAFTNCIFSGNVAAQAGGAFEIAANGATSPVLTNCSFSGNSASNGGAIYNTLATPTLKNCILWGNNNGIFNDNSNPVVTHSIVQGGYPGMGNLNLDPLFISATDLRLQACSPAINTGSNASVPSGITTDLDGNPRFYNNGTVDIGAYEFQAAPTPVVASCQNPTVYLDNTGTASLAAYALDNGSTGCGTLTFSVGGQSSMEFGCNNVGSGNSLTLTVTDNQGVTATCTATVTVVDNVPPTAACQGNVTVQLDENGLGSLSASMLDNGSSDACGNLSFAVVTAALPPPPPSGPTPASGGAAPAPPPTPTPPPGTPLPPTPPSNSQPTVHYDCGFVGEHPYILVVTDENGNFNTCTGTITVEDNLQPTAHCHDLTVQLDENGEATITPEDVDGDGEETSYDNCGIASLSLDVASFSCANVGQENTVELTVTDVNGNENTCTATVTVLDEVAPVAACQENVTVQLDENGLASLSAALLDNGSSDACGNLTFTMKKFSGHAGQNHPRPAVNFDCGAVGEHPYNLVVMDESGNASICTVTVTVEDNTPPSITCPTQATIFVDGNCQAAIPDFTGASVGDNCGILGVTQSPDANTLVGVGAQTVQLTVTDVNGNTNTSCSVSFNVVDNLPPSITCPTQATIFVGGNCQAAIPDFTGAAVSDNCGILSVTQSPAANTPVGVGPQTVSLTVTDVNGNTNTSCSVSFNVVDNTPPSITCPTPITVGNAPGQCSAVVTYTVTGSDNCSFSLSQTGGQASGTAFPVGTTTNTWKATDPANNTATCSFTVTVNKTGDPGLLWAYTVIGFEEVKMKKNTVQSGGVGVTNANKKAKLESNTMVTAANTFVKAPQLDLNGGSQVTTYHAGQVDINLLPAFQSPSANCNNNLDIPDNSAPVTLNLACYGNIKVGKNVTVTFSGHATVNVKDLDLKEGSTVLFAQNTTLLVNKKLDTGKNVTISSGGNTVWLFVDDQVKIDDGNNMVVNMYAKKNLIVEKTPTGNPTYMTGLFIAEKVDSKDNVFWNWDPAVCPYTPPMLLAGLLNFSAQAAGMAEGLRVDLHWLTNTGEMDERYEVEKSADGVDFQPIEAGAAPRNDAKTHLYRDKDTNPQEGDWLYRLKIIRRDGSTAYSEPKRVRIELPVGFTIFPNPASNRVNVYMERFLGKEVDVMVANSLGQVVYQQHIPEVVDRLLPIELDGNTFRDGLYTVSVIHRGRAHTQRLVVARAD